MLKYIVGQTKQLSTSVCTSKMLWFTARKALGLGPSKKQDENNMYIDDTQWSPYNYENFLTQK